MRFLRKLTLKEIEKLNYFTKTELRKLGKKQLIDRLEKELVPGAKHKTVENLKFIQEREAKQQVQKQTNKKQKRQVYDDILEAFKNCKSITVDVTKQGNMKGLEKAIKEICSKNLVKKKVVLIAVDEEGNKKFKTLNEITKVDAESIVLSLTGQIQLKEFDSNTPVDYSENGYFFATNITVTTFDNSKKVTKKRSTKKTSAKKTTEQQFQEKAEELGFEDLPDIDFASYDLRDGAFWAWFNISGVDLSTYQIFNELKAENYKDNCFVWACKQSELFSEEDIEAMIYFMRTRQITLKKLKEIAEAFQIHIKITVPYETSSTKYVHYGKEYDKQLDLLLMNNHFMINKPVAVSTCYLNNKKLIDERYSDMDFIKRCQIKELHKNGSIHRYWPEDHTTPLVTVLKTIFKNKMFIPIRNMEKIYSLGAEYQNKLQDYWRLTYSEKLCTREIAKEIKPKTFSGIYFADFETDTTTKPHTPYLFITTFDNGFKGIVEDNPIVMSTKVLDLFPENSLIYFHNLKYDICFIINNPQAKDVKIIKRTGTVIQVNLTFKGKALTFRDSYCIIPAKLASFGSMFNLPVHKEVMAYKLYTKTNRDRRVIPIEEYFDQLDLENMYKTDSEKQALKDQLLENAKRIPNCYNHDNNSIDIMLYVKFYCQMDCKVLKTGFEKFEHDIAEVFSEYDVEFPGIHNYLSISSLGYALTKAYGCFDECYELAGKPQNFISRAVNGGRTMTAENKIQIVENVVLQDFDAVSLYPSAMYLMPGIPKGIPKVLTKEHIQSIYDNPNTEVLTDYFIEVNITKLKCKSPVDYKFGLVWKLNEKGSKEYGNECVNNRVISKTELLDLLEFYECKYKILRGYYFDEGYNTLIREFIKK